MFVRGIEPVLPSLPPRSMRTEPGGIGTVNYWVTSDTVKVLAQYAARTG